MFFRKRSGEAQSDPTINLNRTDELHMLTSEGYIIAQDIGCQYELIETQRCPHCQGTLLPIAQLNRAFQGLNEIVTICESCSKRHSFIFDISNDVYQQWWAERMGDNYLRIYDGPPRTSQSS
jgi:hypothetical protein